MWRVRCESNSAMFGYRAGFLKADDTVLEFDTEEEAQAACPSTLGRLDAPRYYPVEMN